MVNNVSIGDIVFVSEFNYDENHRGTNHMFVVVSTDKIIDFDCFGFIISSKLKKKSYAYNKELNKDNDNNLRQDSIVKCDNLIGLDKDKISFIVGHVSEEKLNLFLDTYKEYLENKQI